MLRYNTTVANRVYYNTTASRQAVSVLLSRVGLFYHRAVSFISLPLPSLSPSALNCFCFRQYRLVLPCMTYLRPWQFYTLALSPLNMLGRIVLPSLFRARKRHG